MIRAKLIAADRWPEGSDPKSVALRLASYLQPLADGLYERMRPEQAERIQSYLEEIEAGIGIRSTRSRWSTSD